jgi:hypothetical protein
MKNKETLEEVAEKRYGTVITNPKKNITVDIHKDLKIGFIEGAKWQQEQDKKLYSEEEVLELLNNLRLDSYSHGMGRVEFLEWFEQFKKK